MHRPSGTGERRRRRGPGGARCFPAPMTEADKKNVRDALNTYLKPYLRARGSSEQGIRYAAIASGPTSCRLHLRSRFSSSFFRCTGFSKLHRLIFSYSSFFVAPAFQFAPAFRAQRRLLSRLRTKRHRPQSRGRTQ